MFYNFIVYIKRYIRKDELVRAMKEHGMRDEANAKEMISEVDKDNVNRHR